MTPLVSVQRLGVRHRTTGATLVHDIAFDVREGRATAIVGESGSGKSVSLLALLRLLPTALVCAPGSIRTVRGADVATLASASLPAWRAETFGVVPASAGRALDPLRTIAAQAAVIAPRGRPQAAVLMDTLAEVGFDRPQVIAARYPHQLSGGEQQRVAFALALLRDPAVWLIDEPTAALDALGRREVIALLQRLRAARGRAILLVTHDLDVANAIADDVVVVHDGRTVERGAPSTLWRTATAPATRALVDAWPPWPTTWPPPRPIEAAIALAVSDLTVVHDGPPVVDGVSLRIHVGERVAIVGRSGSGKSTLTRALLGAPRRDVQWVMQDAGRSLDPRLTVAQSLREPLLAHGIALGNRIDRVLEEVGLDPAIATRLPHELSTGQQQRVAIARALIVDPSVLVLDEPISALDPVSAARIVARLATIAATRQLTTVFVTHDLARVPQIADRVVVMHDGRVVEDTTTVLALTRPSHAITRALAEAQRDAVV